MCKSKICQRITFIMLFLITILTAIGLGLTIKYTFLDQLDHYQSTYCYETNCTSVLIDRCLGCYNTSITFHLYISNTTNYTKIDWTTNLMWYNHCRDFDFDSPVTCYYDDRNISASLRLFNRYFPDEGADIIAAVSMILLVMVLVTIVFGSIHWMLINSEEIYIDFDDDFW